MVNDLVLGCRTIKCYGWEVYYEDKVRKIRKTHCMYTRFLMSLQTLGSAFFQNTGLLVVLFILLPDWANAKPMRTADVLAVMSMIYVIFFQVNMLCFFGMSSLKTFFAILGRLA